MKGAVRMISEKTKAALLLLRTIAEPEHRRMMAAAMAEKRTSAYMEEFNTFVGKELGIYLYKPKNDALHFPHDELNMAVRGDFDERINEIGVWEDKNFLTPEQGAEARVIVNRCYCFLDDIDRVRELLRELKIEENFGEFIRDDITFDTDYWGNYL